MFRLPGRWDRVGTHAFPTSGAGRGPTTRFCLGATSAGNFVAQSGDRHLQLRGRVWHCGAGRRIAEVWLENQVGRCQEPAMHLEGSGSRRGLDRLVLLSVLCSSPEAASALFRPVVQWPSRSPPGDHVACLAPQFTSTGSREASERNSANGYRAGEVLSTRRLGGRSR